MATIQTRVRGRPAHTRGPTYLSYTPDGTKLVTVGSNNTVRVYSTGSDGEPTNIDECPEMNAGVSSTVRNLLPISNPANKIRITSSLLVQKMEISVNSRWRLWPSRNS